MTSSTKTKFFRTTKEVELYFASPTIECLVCRNRFQRLGNHLMSKHKMSVDAYREQFGLPWTRGLTSATSNEAGKWTEKRKAKARKLAQQTRFFEMARSVQRRKDAPFLKKQRIRNLGGHAIGFGVKFEKQVRSCFAKGMTDKAIAQKLGVARVTVTRLTMHLR